MAFDINKLITLAEGEVGYLEKRTNSQLDSKTANAGSGNYTKYARDLAEISFFNGDKNGYPWCTSFVCWCFYKTYGKENARKLLHIPKLGVSNLAAGCCYAVDYYKNAKAFYKTPKVGDQIFFDWDHDGEADHTGIVRKVTSSYVYTVEGNSGNAVKMKQYSLSNSDIYGYGRPDYGASTSTKEPEKAPEKKPTTKGYDVMVMASSGLNLRKGAGTSYPVLTAAYWGSILHISSETNGWGLTSFNGKTGYVCLAYTKKV